MHLLVTRPERDAREFAGRLEGEGHHCTISPLLKIAFKEPPDLETDKIHAVVITSRNAVRALENHPDAAALYQKPLFAVGSATTDAARHAGFEKIMASARDAKSLAPTIIEQCSPSDGPLLYLTGAHVAFDMQGNLANEGFEVTRALLYETRPCDDLTEAAKTGLTSGDIDAVILLSPRTAAVFSSLLTKHDLTRARQKLIYFCLSENTAKRLNDVPDRYVRLAKVPNISAMIEAINEYKS